MLKRCISLLAVLAMAAALVLLPVSAAGEFRFDLDVSATYEDGDDLITEGVFYNDIQGAEATAAVMTEDGKTFARIRGTVPEGSGNGAGGAFVRFDEAFTGKLHVEFSARVNDLAYRHFPNMDEAVVCTGQPDGLLLQSVDGTPKVPITTGWHDYHYVIDLDARSLQLYLDDNAVPYGGKLTGDKKEIGAMVFRSWTADQYIDLASLHVYPDDGTRMPAAPFEQNFEELDNSTVGSVLTGGNVTVGEEGGNKYASIDGTGQSKLTFAQPYSGKVHVKYRMHVNDLLYRQAPVMISSHNLQNGGTEPIMIAVFDQNKLLLQRVGDIYLELQSNQWISYHYILDFDTHTMELYLGDSATLAAQGSIAQEHSDLAQMCFQNFSQDQSQTLHLDDFEVYEDDGTQPPEEGKRIEENFNGLDVGAASSVLSNVTVQEDAGGNRYGAADSNAQAKIVLSDPYAGKVHIKFDIKIAAELTQYQQLPLLASSYTVNNSWDPPLMVAGIDTGIGKLAVQRVGITQNFDLTDDWMSFHYIFDFDSRTVEMYIDNALAGQGTMGSDVHEDLAQVIFSPSAAGSLLFDNIEVYEDDGSEQPPEPPEEIGWTEDFSDYEQGSNLTEHGWEAADNSVALPELTVVQDGDNKYARFNPAGAGQSGTARVDVTDHIPAAGVYTVEMRMKMSTADYKQFGLCDANWAYAFQLATARQSGSQIPYVRNIIDNTNQKDVIGYDVDSDPAKPDFTRGWQTYWMTVDRDTNTATMYIDDKTVSETYTYNVDNFAAKYLRFNMQNAAGVANNQIYLDYVKIYEGAARDVPDSTPAPGFAENFDTLTAGTSLNSSIFYRENGTLDATVIADPYGDGTGDQCVQIKRPDTNNSAMRLTMARPLTGKVAVELKAMVSNTATYMQMPNIRSTQSEFVVASLDTANGVVALRGGNAPLTTDKWTAYKYVIDTATREFKLYIDGADTPTVTAIIDDTKNADISNLGFAMQGGSADSSLYIDDIKIYKDNSSVEPPEEITPAERGNEMFDYPDGTQLVGGAAGFGWTGGTGEGFTSQVYNNGTLAAGVFGVTGTGATTYDYDLTSVPGLTAQDSFTLEFRAKFLNDAYKQLALMGEGDKMFAQLMLTNYSGGPNIGDILNESAVVSALDVDANPGAPDLNTGWHTYYIYVDRAGQKVTFYRDSQATETALGFDPAALSVPLNKLRLNPQNGGTASPNLSYFDYIKVYKGAPSVPANRKSFEQNFENYAAGANAFGIEGITGNANLAATVVTDPLNPGNKCATFKPKDAASVTGDKSFSFSFGMNMTGKVIVEYRAMVNDATYRHLPNIHSTGSGAESEAIVFQGDATLNASAGSFEAPVNKWTKYRFEIDLGAGKYDLYINDNRTAPAVSGTVGKNPLKDLSFLIGGNNVATSTIWLDDIMVYEDDGTPIIYADTPAGIVEYGAKVKLTSNVPGTVIHYTIDGTQPTAESPVAPADGIVITASPCTIKAMGVAGETEGWTYTFGPYTFKSVEGMVLTDVRLQKNGADVAMSDIQAGDTVTVKFTFFNTNTAAKPAALIVGLYNGDIMKNAFFEDKTFAVGEDSQTVSLTIPAGTSLTGCSLRAFAWDGIDSLRPLCSVTEFK